MAAAPDPLPDRRLAYVARRQAGVFTRQQALEAGVTRRRIAHLRTVGAWEDCHPGRGVYRVAAAPRTWEAELHAALLASGPRAVVSHLSAGRLWRLPDLEKTPAVHVLVRARSARAPRGVRVHLTGWLPDEHITRVGAFPTTTVTRTVRDCCRYLDTGRMLPVALEAWRRRQTDPERLARCTAELGTGRGAATAWAVLNELDADCLRTRSVPELTLHLGLVRHGRFPPHVLNHPVTLPSGRRVVFDIAWPPQRAAIEVDSERYHTTAYDRARDARRDRDTAEGGWRVLRVWTAELADLANVLARIEALLERTGGVEPRG